MLLYQSLASQTLRYDSQRVSSLHTPCFDLLLFAKLQLEPVFAPLNDLHQSFKTNPLKHTQQASTQDERLDAQIRTTIKRQKVQ